jgi:hypothetical protein
MTPDDLAGVLKESRGVELRDGAGALRNHLDEGLLARRSLVHAVGELRARLARLQGSGGAAPGELDLLRRKLSDLSTALDQYPRPDPLQAAKIAARKGG